MVEQICSDWDPFIQASGDYDDDNETDDLGLIQLIRVWWNGMMVVREGVPL